MPTVTMTVNGKKVSGEVEARTLLVQFLRENLRLTGTHVGCDTSQCGACVVEADGKAIKSCTALAVSCEGSQVTTIEGLASNGQLHPMQEAFRTHHGLQCGFCTPGMIIAASVLLRKNSDPSDADIDDAIRNLCRCGTYPRVRAAIKRAGRVMRRQETIAAAPPPGITPEDAAKNVPALTPPE